MKIGYFDMVGGAAGDMILAALIDAGADPSAIDDVLSGTGVIYKINVEKLDSSGLSVTRVNVQAQDESSHRHLPDVLEIIEKSSASSTAKQKAAAVFQALAAAEAKAHGTDLDHVHFHEVGAVDAIVDILGAAILTEQLNLCLLASSPFPLGRGVIHCQHGVMPAPAPATLNLLEGRPVVPSDAGFETVTPTGAAILTTLCERFGPMPSMTLEKTGIGAGARESAPPNWIRLLIGNMRETATETITAIETNLDDMTPEAIAHLTTRIMDSGALDCYVTPILMKKGRPGQCLTALASPQTAQQIARLILQDSSSFGVRFREMDRICLERETKEVDTQYGRIRVKIGYLDGQVVKSSPEFEDCRTAAEQHHVPLTTVQQAAISQL